MTSHNRRRKPPRSGPLDTGSAPKRSNRGFGLRPIGEGRFELTHPPCVIEREDDYREGLDAWRAGEPEEAREILRFALEDCGDNLWVHTALGRIALDMGDPILARGHFGYAFELVRSLVEPLPAGSLDPDTSGNRPFFDACDGLIDCQRCQGQTAPAESLQRLRDRLAPRPIL